METLLGSSLGTATETLGFLLVHFVWQGAVLAGLLSVALMATRFSSASVRHALACITLVLMLLAPLATLLWMGVPLPAARFASEAPKRSAPQYLDPPSSELSLPFASASSLGLAGSQWMSGIGLAWLLGIAGFSLRWAGAWRQVHRLKTVDVHPVGSEFLERFERLRVRIGVRSRVRFMESARVHGPMVIGWLRPVILMPMGLLTGLPASQVESLILHELAHIRGNDYLINLIVRFAETVLFYHPAVWWVGKQIEQEREKRCDDIVCEVMGEGQSLAEALLNLCEREAGVSSLALAATGSSIGDRVRRLAGQEVVGTKLPIRRRWGWAMVLIVLLVGAALMVSTISSSFLYTARVRIRVEQPLRPERIPPTSYDPYFVPTWMMSMRSDPLLGDVVQKRNLTNTWHLSEAQCIEKLRRRSSMQQFRSTSIIELRVADESAEMAAQLANWHAEAIINHFESRYQLEHQEAYQSKKRKSAYLEAEILAVSSQLAELNQKANKRLMFKPDPEDKLPEPGRVEMLTDRLQLLRDLKREDERRAVESIGVVDPSDSYKVEIFESAVPALRRTFWRSAD